MVTCPVCGSNNQQSSEFLVKYLDPITGKPMEISTEGFICLDCKEDWQTATQHIQFDDKKKKVKAIK